MALRAMFKGDLSELEGELENWSETISWPRADSVPRDIATRARDLHGRAHARGLYLLNPKSAFERLDLHASSSNYQDTIFKELAVGGLPAKGQVVAWSKGRISLPPRGTVPCDITKFSERARYYFTHYREKMLKPAHLVDLDDIRQTKTYMDPNLRTKTKKLELAVLLYEAGMLAVTNERRSGISVFFVMKKVEEDEMILRPVWDMRAVNKFFQRPPSLRLGTPAAIGQLELSDEVLQGRTVLTAWGDVPDYFHRCKAPSWLWEYMVLDGLSPADLRRELRSRGWKGKLPDEGSFLCLCVMLMGFSWSPAICHNALEDILIGQPHFPPGGQVAVHQPPPDFRTAAQLYWIYMDDVFNLSLGLPSDLESVEKVREAMRERLKETGLPMHKDGVAAGVPASLGIMIDADTLDLEPTPEKFQLLIAATRHLIDVKCCSPKVLAKLNGSWVWALMCARPALSLMNATFKFVVKYELSDTPRPLWDSVVGELRALYYLAPFFKTSLKRPWSTTVFASDASEEGFGVTHTTATSEEVREEVSRRWAAPPALFNECEETDEEMEDDPNQEALRRMGLDLTVLPSAPICTRSMCDVFSGQGGFGSAVADSCYCKVVYIDTARDPSHDLLRTGFLERLVGLIQSGYFFMVHLAPPCSTWSRARRPPLRARGDRIYGLPDLNRAQRRRAEEGNSLARAAVRLVRSCIEAKVGFSIENPCSSMLWDMPEMIDIKNTSGTTSVSLVYCAYGAKWLKPTRLLTNVKELASLARSCTGDHKHQTLRGLSPEGVLWTRLAAAYPQGLCAAYGEAVRLACQRGQLTPHLAVERPRARTPAGRVPRPVESSWSLPSRWELTWKGRWKYDGHINALELQTVQGIARHLARARTSWDQRFLVLCDSMVTIGCCHKMRSRSFKLLRGVRQLGAVELACGVNLLLRWIPSAWNPADGPSRGEPVGPAQETALKDKAFSDLMNNDKDDFFLTLVGDPTELGEEYLRGGRL